MKLCERRESGKRATGHVRARPEPQNDAADTDDIETFIAPGGTT